MRNCWAHNIQPGSRTCPASPHGGNCIIRTPTRRRHAEAKLLMLQNPHRSQPHAPRHLQDLAAEPIDAKNSPSTAPPVALPRKNSPCTPENADFELFFVRRATFFALTTRQRGDIETNNTTAHPQQGTAETGITSAQAKCTKNAHFSPAKAMTVSIPHGYKRAKAMTVSDHRSTRPTAPGCDPLGGDDTTAPKFRMQFNWVKFQ